MDIVFLILIFALAVLYSSVGHGGASGYLALMAIFSFSPEFMRPSALVLNIFVSSISFFSYYKNGHFRLKLLMPFIVTSVPVAFIGGAITANPKTYKIILGVFLILAITRMVFQPKSEAGQIKPVKKNIAWGLGVFLGLFSGLIGIGGGIILSPILVLLKWGTIKQIAAISAAFIFVNSVSGLLGQVFQGIQFSPQILYMLVAAVLGGSMGAYMGSFRVSNVVLRYTLSVVLILASFKLLFL